MDFNSLSLIEPILKALDSQGYETPTPIQKQAIPAVLKGRDIIGIAQTGTGKTVAFVAPILQKLHENQAPQKSPRALILAPTRELAAQISQSITVYGKFLKSKHAVVFGGVATQPQIKAIQKGIDILVATPGRLLDLMNQKKVKLGSVELLVLDEADRMLDMGFLRDVTNIISKVPQKRQSLFFSATMSKAIQDLTSDFLKDPLKIEITPQSTPVEKIEQCVFFVDQKNKNELLLEIIEEHNMDSVLVFVGMKHKANKIALILNRNGIKSDAIHGNKSQFQRTKALSDFKRGKVRVLVATDIAARGIDIENISHVINYDLPNEPENYVHRIGRTARAGASGTAYSFCAADERNYLNQIERTITKKIEHAEHKYHSAKAKSAKGSDAQPRRKKSFGGRRKSVQSKNRSRDRPRGKREDQRRGSSMGSRSKRSEHSRGRKTSHRPRPSSRPRRR